MIGVLERELIGRANVEIRPENALKLDYAPLAERAGKPLVVVGNLPYQIASPLLFAMVEARQHLSRAIVMLQKEMAERLVAKPATPEYGALGAMIALYADVKPVIKARAGAFLPPPKVDSAVVALELRRSLRAAVDEKQYHRVVHAAFGMRRKTLRNALRALWQADDVNGALAAAEIDGGRRGETLSVEEFARLAGALPEGHARAS
jgi:16S rRNA (adenine1518-N6/adenine1519-N6)-dimethyltransferase